MQAFCRLLWQIIDGFFRPRMLNTQKTSAIIVYDVYGIKGIFQEVQKFVIFGQYP